MNDLEFEGFRLDLSRRQLRQGEDVLSLPAKAFDLLVYLAKNPGRPVQKSELISHIWPDSFVEDSNLNQTVFLARKALGPQHERLIVTLPRVGYQFSAQVQELPARSGQPPQGPASIENPALSPEDFSSETTISRVVYEEETEERVAFYRSKLVLSLSGLALVLLAVAAWLGWQRWQDHVGGPPVQVVIAEPDGSTGDPLLDRTLGTVFRMELAQSPFVTILSGANVKAKLVQMQHKPDDHLTPSLAQEVCERSGSQAVVHGSVAKSGSHYVLTEEATSCVDGSSLGEASREVSNSDRLPGALAKLAAGIRHSLGESRRAIARFNRPLSAVTTGSLEALKDLTEAERLISLGRVPEGVDLLKQAVTIDPKFAAAWLDLSTFALNAHETDLGRGYLQKAYDLRENATEPTRRLIVARYNGEVTGDLYQSLRNYQTWADEYPRQPVPWSGMTVVLHTLGRTEDELIAARHTMAVAPNYQVVYQGLADAQVRNGDFAGARATIQAGIVKGLDGETLRLLLLRLGYLQHDPALVAEQKAWGREHPGSFYLIANEAIIAQIQGRTEEADKLYQALTDASKHAGLEGLLNTILTQAVAIDAAYGRTERARQRLAALTPSLTNAVYLAALQSTGENAKAESLLKEQLAANPRSTLWNDWDGPNLRGKILLDQQKPREALTALEPTRAFDRKDVTAIYLRGLADLQLKQLPEAEAEFRKIIDLPGIDPTAFERPLAQLQLARALAQQKNKPAATEAYNTFLTLWARADPGQPLLLAAKKESEALEHGN